jgi:hypothetical protein
MLGLCLVEVSPHPQGMPLSSFSVSSGIAAGRSGACCSWLADEVTEGLGRNGPPLGRTKRLPEIWVPGAICPKGRDEEIQRQQRGRLSQRLSRVHGRMAQAYPDKLDGKTSDEFWMRKSEVAGRGKPLWLQQAVRPDLPKYRNRGIVRFRGRF